MDISNPFFFSFGLRLWTYWSSGLIFFFSCIWPDPESHYQTFTIVDNSLLCTIYSEQANTYQLWIILHYNNNILLKDQIMWMRQDHGHEYNLLDQREKSVKGCQILCLFKNDYIPDGWWWLVEQKCQAVTQCSVATSVGLILL